METCWDEFSFLRKAKFKVFEDGQGSGEGDEKQEDRRHKGRIECQDLKDVERSLRRAKSGKTLVEARSPNRSLCLEKGAKDRPEPSHSWFPPEFPSGYLETDSFMR